MSKKEAAAEVAPLTRDEFEALPVVEQRKVLARDVLNAIDASWFKGNVKGRLFSNRANETHSLEVESADEAVRKARTCHVCAAGAPMVAAAIRVDRLHEHLEEWQLGGCVGGARAYLAPYFPDEMLKMVEAAYEADEDYVYAAFGGVLPTATADEREALSRFRSAHNYGTPRLRAIWQRVADDPQGLFRLEGL